ncbi:MAG: HNH endonuclease [Proteobacteria bacterium]|nr:MAG: HNH endonuclease [Pseudomonadota bacterium]
MAELFDALENRSTFETVQMLAKVFDQPVVEHQRIRPQQDDSVRVEFTLSKEEFEIVRSAQALASHAVDSNQLKDLLVHLSTKLIKKHAGRASPKVDESKITTVQETLTHGLSLEQQSLPTPVEKRKYISVSIKRRLLAKAENKCEHVDPVSRRKCRSNWQLQVDHVIPLALGGEDTESNMRILCGTHNRSEARRLGLVI